MNLHAVIWWYLPFCIHTGTYNVYSYVSKIHTVVVTEDPGVPVRLVAVGGNVLFPSRVPTHEDTGLGAETVHTGQELGHVRPR